MALYERVEGEMKEEGRIRNKGKSKVQNQSTNQNQGIVKRTMTHNVWTALVHLFLTIIRNVGVASADGSMEDGLFDILGPWAREREDVRAALEEVNADALWLVEERMRVKEAMMEKEKGERKRKRKKPESTVEGWEFADVDVELELGV